MNIVVIDVERDFNDLSRVCLIIDQRRPARLTRLQDWIYYVSKFSHDRESNERQHASAHL